MKKFLALLPILAVWLCVASAQTPTVPPAPSLDALKQYLNLTDQQVQQLLDLRRQEAEAVRAIREQILTKRQTLREKLQAGAPAQEIGTLNLEIHQLHQQVLTIHEQYHQKALAILDASQQQKLAQLEEAARLMPAIGQARALGLIARQTPAWGCGLGPGPRGLGLGLGLGLGPGPQGMRWAAPATGQARRGEPYRPRL